MDFKGELKPIFYLVKAANSRAMRDYLDGWGKPLADRIYLVPYEELLGIEQFPGGVYIFSDLERLNRYQKSLVQELWNRLDEAGEGYTLLNNPAASMGRYELLSLLYQRGMNSYAIYRVDEIPRPIQKPVFLRHIYEHGGTFTQVFSHEEELDEAIALLILKGIPPEELAAVEYCETADSEGIYRKYSIFRIGNSYLPRHEIFSQKWDLKYPDLLEPAMIAEEMSFLETDPHQEECRKIFDVARIDYGRIDYGLKEGKLEVWEINTNPIVMMPHQNYNEVHIPAQEWFAGRAEKAFEELAADLPDREPIRVAFDSELIRNIITNIE
jgi:hypothetical protein